MKFQTTSGNVIEATLTTDHSMSSYGLPVLVDVDGNAYSHAETFNWIIESATADERRALVLSGYGVIRDLELEAERENELEAERENEMENERENELENEREDELENEREDELENEREDELGSGGR